MKSHNIKKIFFVALWLLIWQFCYLYVGRDIIVASPLAVFQHLGALATTKQFYVTILYTFRRIFIGFIFSILVGSLLAILSYILPWFREFISPAMSIMKVTPVASFIIITLIFMKAEYIPSLIGFFMVTPLVFTNMLNALNQVDKDLIEMSRSFQVPFLEQLKHIYLPTALPYFFASLQTGFGYSWKSCITAEVLATTKGSIGATLADAKIYLQTTTVFAWTLVIIVLSLISEKILMKIVKNIINHFYPLVKLERNTTLDSPL